MKKLEKLTLNELKNEISAIGDVNANCLKGGYTWDEMERRMGNGNWYGGFVNGWGYVCQDVDVFGEYTGDQYGHFGDTSAGVGSGGYLLDPFFYSYGNDVSYDNQGSSGGSADSGGDTESNKVLTYYNTTDYIPSYGIPDRGLTASYSLDVSATCENRNFLNIGVSSTETGTKISGSVDLYVNGAIVSTQNLVLSGEYITQQGMLPVGGAYFNISQYNSSGEIYIIVRTTQVDDSSGGGSTPNILGESATRLDIN